MMLDEMTTGDGRSRRWPAQLRRDLQSPGDGSERAVGPPAGFVEKGLIFNPAGTQLDFTVPQFAGYLRRVPPV
jgi:hypothetical protein